MRPLPASVSAATEILALRLVDGEEEEEVVVVVEVEVEVEVVEEKDDKE